MEKIEGREKLNTSNEWLGFGAEFVCREDCGFSSRNTVLFENTGADCKEALLGDRMVAAFLSYFCSVTVFWWLKKPFEISVGSGVAPARSSGYLFPLSCIWSSSWWITCPDGFCPEDFTCLSNHNHSSTNLWMPGRAIPRPMLPSWSLPSWRNFQSTDPQNKA